MFILKANKQ